MAITNIKVSNFKSFKDLDLNLGRFNVVIGANASGKSNFVEIFRFLKTLERENLDDAVSLHGGPDDITNRRLGRAEPLRMRVTSDWQMTWAGTKADIRVRETIYDFSLRFQSPQDGTWIEKDRLTQKLLARIGDEDAEMSLDILQSQGSPSIEIGPNDVVERIKKTWASSESPLLRSSDPGFDSFRSFVSVMLAGKEGVLLIQNRALSGLTGAFESMFGRVGVYDIQPQEIKKPHETAGIPRLEKDGKNLALVLKQILADSEKSRMFQNLLRDMLPFAVEIGVEQHLGVSLLLKLREAYHESSLLANLLSDGTVDVAALITALFFEDKDVVIIEEPERNIHPRLISGLVELMKDASRNRQIIITTHSPEVVKHAGVENLLLILRDEKGFSTISRPAEKEAVRVFLEHELGLDDLFVQDVLAVP
jgi:predicted ATPase